jgi:hypothetical protein
MGRLTGQEAVVKVMEKVLGEGKQYDNEMSELAEEEVNPAMLAEGEDKNKKMLATAATAHAASHFLGANVKMRFPARALEQMGAGILTEGAIREGPGPTNSHLQ